MNRVLHVICSCSVNVAFASLSHGPYGTERPFIVNLLGKSGDSPRLKNACA